jgi:hypothetical protein
MKPTVPAVPLSIWKDLYSAAQKFYALRPWEMLDDTDLIGVRDPDTGETGFSVVMGNGGTLFGFCLYRGAEGFDIYRRLMEGTIDVERDDFFAIQNCLKLELGPRADLQPEDHMVIRQLGLSFKGNHAWPEFRSLLHEYVPWFLTDAEAPFLTLGLSVACHHVKRINNGDVDESMRDGECLVYTPVVGAETEYRAQWEAWPMPAHHSVAPLVLNLARLNALRAKKTKPDSPWEADMFYLPSPILDRERPYYLRLAAVCQQTSGFVFAAEPSPPEQSGHQSLADAICSSVERHGFLPETIFVKGPEEAAALTPLANVLGLTIRRRKRLKAIQMLKEDMMMQVVYGGGGRRKR